MLLVSLVDDQYCTAAAPGNAVLSSAGLPCTTSENNSSLVGKRQPPPASESPLQCAIASAWLYCFAVSVSCCQVSPQHDEVTVPFLLSLKLGALQPLSLAQTGHF